MENSFTILPKSQMEEIRKHLHLKARYKERFWVVGRVEMNSFDDFEKFLRSSVKPLSGTNSRSHPLRFEHKDSCGDMVQIDSDLTLKCAVDLCCSKQTINDLEKGIKPFLFHVDVFDCDGEESSNSQAMVEFPNSTCNLCGKTPIIGVAYRCLVREKCMVCDSCEAQEALEHFNSRQKNPFFYVKFSDPSQIAKFDEFVGKVHLTNKSKSVQTENESKPPNSSKFCIEGIDSESSISLDDPDEIESRVISIESKLQSGHEMGNSEISVGHRAMDIDDASRNNAEPKLIGLSISEDHSDIEVRSESSDSLRAETESEHSVASSISMPSQMPSEIVSTMAEETLSGHIENSLSSDFKSHLTLSVGHENEANIQNVESSDSQLVASIGKLGSTISASMNKNIILKKVERQYIVTLENAIDNTYFVTSKPNDEFDVTINFENSGTCALPDDTCLIKVEDADLQCPDSIVVGSIEPGQDFPIVVKFVGSESIGHFKTTWQLKSSEKDIGPAICIDALIEDSAVTENNNTVSARSSGDWSLVDEVGQVDENTENNDSNRLLINGNLNNSLNISVNKGKATVAYNVLKSHKNSLWLYIEETNSLGEKMVDFAEDLKMLSIIGFGCGCNVFRKLQNRKMNGNETKMDELVSGFIEQDYLQIAADSKIEDSIIRIFCGIGLFPDVNYQRCIQPMKELVRSYAENVIESDSFEIMKNVIGILFIVSMENDDARMGEVLNGALEKLNNRWNYELNALKEMGFHEHNNQLRTLLERHCIVPRASGINEIIPLLLSGVPSL